MPDSSGLGRQQVLLEQFHIRLVVRSFGDLHKDLFGVRALGLQIPEAGRLLRQFEFLSIVREHLLVLRFDHLAVIALDIVFLHSALARLHEADHGLAAVRVIHFFGIIEQINIRSQTFGPLSLL